MYTQFHPKWMDGKPSNPFVIRFSGELGTTTASSFES